MQKEIPSVLKKLFVLGMRDILDRWMSSDSFRFHASTK
mgnify:CR=1 FL=1